MNGYPKCKNRPIWSHWLWRRMQALSEIYATIRCYPWIPKSAYVSLDCASYYSTYLEQYLAQNYFPMTQQRKVAFSIRLKPLWLPIMEHSPSRKKQNALKTLFYVQRSTLKFECGDTKYFLLAGENKRESQVNSLSADNDKGKANNILLESHLSRHCLSPP